MKTPVRSTALHLFVASCSGIVFLSLAVCQSLTTLPEPQFKLVHSVRQTYELDTVSHQFGLRAKDKNFNAELVTEFQADLGRIEVVPQEIGRVLLNLYNNAFYAVQQRSKNLTAGTPDRSEDRPGLTSYQPTVTVSTRQVNGYVQIRVGDNGTGIPEAVKAKIFQPFFTTKPTGEGTGLGLSLSYDIITKGHGGTLTVESVEGEGTTFVMQLPC